jgi:hypothetical protein
MTGVSTNTSSTPIAGYMGNKTFSGTLVCNAGGSTNCGITYTIWGSMTNSNTAGVSLCTVVIPTGSATTYGDCAGVVTASYAYLYAITTGVAGTSPSLTITMGY